MAPQRMVALFVYAASSSQREMPEDIFFPINCKQITMHKANVLRVLPFRQKIFWAKRFIRFESSAAVDSANSHLSFTMSHLRENEDERPNLVRNLPFKRSICNPQVTNLWVYSLQVIPNNFLVQKLLIICPDRKTLSRLDGKHSSGYLVCKPNFRMPICIPIWPSDFGGYKTKT